MSDMPDLQRSWRAAAESARRALEAAGIAPAPLVQSVPEHRWLGLVPRAARVRRVGEAWRLGVLLLTIDGTLLGGAETARAKRPARVGYVAESARARDAVRHALFRGGVPEGQAAHLDARPLDECDEVAGRDGALVVRWAPGAPLASAIPLDAYLAERVRLLVEPPAAG